LVEGQGAQVPVGHTHAFHVRFRRMRLVLHASE